jgi:Putative Actinobacterial Holin-X, holin superfamily III
MGNGESIMGLVKDLKEQVRTFVGEEINLARTEVSEKASSVRQHAVGLAIGGFLAYTGLIVFVVGLGALVAFAFQRLGLNGLLATFVGLAVVGLLVTGSGGLLVWTGIQAFKKASLTPKKALRTLQRLKGEPAPLPKESAAESKEPDHRTSTEIETSARIKGYEMTHTLEQLQSRMTFSNFKRQARAKVLTHPFRWGLAATAAGGLTITHLVRRRRLSRKAA